MEEFLKQLMPLADVAKLHKVSHVSVWNWIQKGYLPAIKVNTDWYVNEQDAKAFKRPEQGRPVQHVKSEARINLERALAERAKQDN